MAAANVTTQDLETALSTLANQMGLSVVEYVQGGFVDLTTYGTDKSAILARLDKLDVIDSADGVDTLAEKVAALNSLLTDPANSTLATDILTRIADNAAAIAAETTRATGVEAGLRTDVDTANAGVVSVSSTLSGLIATVAANKTASEAADTGLSDRITVNEGDLTTLKGDKTVVGSVDYKVEQEAIRAKAAEAANRTASDAAIAQNLVDAKAYTDTSVGSEATRVDAKIAADVAVETARATAVEAGLQSGIDGNTAALTTLNGNVTVDGSVDKKVADAIAASEATQATKDAAQDTAIGVAQAQADKGVVDAAGALTAAQTAQAGVDTLNGDKTVTGSVDSKIEAARVAAEAVMDTKVAVETARATAVETDLQSQVDDLTGTGTGSLGDIESRTTALENDMNDTVDADSNVVKGVKTIATENQTGLAAEIVRAKAAEEQVLVDAKAYSDANDLKAATMDICVINNSFRSALGLNLVDCAASGGGAI